MTVTAAPHTARRPRPFLTAAFTRTAGPSRPGAGAAGRQRKFGPAFLSAVFLLAGCAAPASIQPTDNIRNARDVEKSSTILFQNIAVPDNVNATLQIEILRRVTYERVHERQFQTQAVQQGGGGARLLLGLLLAGGGYYEMTIGYVVLGRDLIGVGALIALGAGGSSTPSSGQGTVVQWKEETETLPPQTQPAAQRQLAVSVADSSYLASTDADGRFTVNVAAFASRVALGGEMDIRIALADDPSNGVSYSVPESVLVHHRAASQVEFALTSARFSEDSSLVRIRVGLSAPTSREVAVDYTVTTGIAGADTSDYRLADGTITIPAGIDAAEILLIIRDDEEVEGDENIVITLSNPLNAVLGINTTYTYTIIDNDVPPAPEEPEEPVERITIAVLDFDAYGVSESEARVLTNRLGTHLFQVGQYQVIERGQMQQILQEQEFQDYLGCASNECAVEVGQLLGCEHMLAGSFGKIGSVYTIDMRIIDVASGSILRTTSYDVRGAVDLLLTEGLAEAVRQLLASTSR